MGEGDLLRALYIPYERVHFLINREQCATSVFAADVRRDGTQLPYYQETIGIDGHRYRLMDLHRYLSDLFHASGTEKAQLALMLPLERVAEATRRVLREGPLEGVDDKQLVLRVSSETVMQSIPVPSLRTHGLTLGDHLVERGIIALHPQGASFGFLVDLNELLVLSVTGTV